jgi:hypothetical protein
MSKAAVSKLKGKRAMLTAIIRATQVRVNIERPPGDRKIVAILEYRPSSVAEAAALITCKRIECTYLGSRRLAVSMEVIGESGWIASPQEAGENTRVERLELAKIKWYPRYFKHDESLFAESAAYIRVCAVRRAIPIVSLNSRWHLQSLVFMSISIWTGEPAWLSWLRVTVSATQNSVNY